MSDSQLELARWLAGSEAWRGWCEAHPDERVPSVCPLLDDGWVDGSVPFARFWLRLPDVYLPRLDTSRLVGPLIEMLRAATKAKGHAHPPSLYCEDGPESWSACLYPHQDGNSMFTRGHMPDDTTDAEALCALLREVVG